MALNCRGLQVRAHAANSSPQHATECSCARTILVASKNPVKINAVQQAIQRCFPELQVAVAGREAPSGVPDQPYGDEETLAGARNRVAALLQDLTSPSSTSSTSRTCYPPDTPPSVPFSDVPANPTIPSITPPTSNPQPTNPNPSPSDTHLLETRRASSPCGQPLSNAQDPSTEQPLWLSGAGSSGGSDGGDVGGGGFGRDFCGRIAGGGGSGAGDLVVAIEGGVGRVACHPGATQLAGELECFAWVCVRDPITGAESTARSASFVLPAPLSDLILHRGMELGDADDTVFGRVNSKRGSGTIGQLSNGVLDRTEYYVQATICALLPYMHPDLYGVGYKQFVNK